MAHCGGAYQSSRSGLRNREAIPETLPICIPPCVSPECDARTCNMFIYLRALGWALGFGRPPAALPTSTDRRPATYDQTPPVTTHSLLPQIPRYRLFPVHPHPLCNSFHLGITPTSAND